MAALLKAMRDEIARVNKRELGPQLKKLRSEAAALRNEVAVLKKRQDSLERACARVGLAAAPDTRAVDIFGEDVSSIRPTGTKIRQLRQKYEVTQAELGKLLGVSPQSVYLWERKSSSLRLRKKTRRELVALCQMGKREVHERLQSM